MGPVRFAAAVLITVSASTVVRAGNERVLDKIAAVVGDKIILLSEVRALAEPAMKQLEKAASGGAELMAADRKDKIIQESLDQMIDDALLDIESKKMEMSVTSEEVDRAMANMARENNIDVETLTKAIKSQGLDIGSYRKKLRSQILRYKVLNLRVRGRVKISDAEARQYYNDQVRDVRATGTFEGAHILVRVSPNAKAALVAEARKRAEAILARIQSGEDFAKVAQAESDDRATVSGGGSLGRQNPGRIPAVLDKVFLDMEVGEIEGPIRTPSGFHILRLNDRDVLGVQPFSEVKDRITAQLAQEEMLRQEKVWFKELRLKTFVDIRL